METHLFLFGGGPPFSTGLAARFAELAGGAGSLVTILCVDRPGWEEYMPHYTKALEERGVARFRYVPLPTTPEIEAVEALRASSGIIIGGGDTNLYADYIVETGIGPVIAERHAAGIPVAGFSAGALGN
ncbi:Type 1 glutamine amidotransferase-like domain-containing protein [Paenibacillus humicus]|uniref:Type 1 glutamine amidotransferase-like domain-containing protein n=1 Tax=Paenibacillus humicus TaxID=412861 RepID=UPI003F13D17F